MYIVCNLEETMFLSVVIEEGCDHWTPNKKEAHVFFKKLDIPKRFNKCKIIKDGQKHKLYGGQTQSLSTINKETGISLTSLYEYCRGVKDVENMPSSIERKLADYFGWEQGRFHDELIKYRNKNKKGRR